MLIICVLSGHSNAQEKSPKTVIGIVVENMRPDYIQRFWNKFGEDGFKKIYNGGAVCSNVRLTLHSPNYANGTATIFTGVQPSIHGIINPTWYDRENKKEINCTEDDNYKTVGATTDKGKASPLKLLSSTITNNLKVYTRGQSKVYGIAINQESAIFSAGHAADCAYWFDIESGRMVTSSFYIKFAPDWLLNFNGENYAEQYCFQNWTTLLKEDQYIEALPDGYMFEKGYFDEHKSFPHAVNQYVKRTGNLKPFKTIPLANTLIKDFALELINNEGIGQDNVTDFLNVVFSSMDYENVSFGPASLEMMDSYLYLDKTLTEFINGVEKKLGKENVIFFLTANTSASYPVEYLKNEFHMPVDYFDMERAISLLTLFLNNTYGEGEWIENISNLHVYLDHDLVKEKGLDIKEVSETTSNFMNQFEGVQLSIPAHQLELGTSSSGVLGRLNASYYKNRSGDFQFLLKEGWQPKYKFKKINYCDQAHIPLVFFGKNIKHKIIKEKYSGVDIVPTLSEILNIPAPDKCQGKMIKELFE